MTRQRHRWYSDLLKGTLNHRQETRHIWFVFGLKRKRWFRIEENGSHFYCDMEEGIDIIKDDFWSTNIGKETSLMDAVSRCLNY